MDGMTRDAAVAAAAAAQAAAAAAAGDREGEDEVHNRNLIRSKEHLSVSVDNDRSNLDALNESQNPKIDSSNSKSTTESYRTYSGLEDEEEEDEDAVVAAAAGADPRLQQPCTARSNQRHVCGGSSRSCRESAVKNSQKLREQKNEILSRTVGVRELFKKLYYSMIILLIINAQLGVADSASLSRGEASAVGRLSGEGGHRQVAKQRKVVNKNCKEYDITSRAFSADLIFEGRARSKREMGQYITFGIQKILKQRKSGLKPKGQIRLHYGSKRNSGQTRGSFLNDCLIRSAPAGDAAARWKLKFGVRYYVFADLSGPMNYTAKGDPVVANRRNLKSILSVTSRDKEKPPRVRGLQDQNLKAGSELRLTCRIKGTPVPRINWYKDSVPLIPSSHVNVTYYRKNSTIEIKSLDMEDRGRYECKATSVTGKTANMSAYVNVSEFYTETTTDPDWPFRTVKCQVDSYCLNEGKCEFIEKLGEHMCKCKSGYVGARCENKQLSTIEFLTESGQLGK